MSDHSSQAAAGASGSQKQSKQKSKKDKSQKKAQPAQPSGAEVDGGFSLLGAGKDAELDDVFGKSSAFAAPAPPKPAANPRPVPAAAAEDVSAPIAGSSTTKKRSVDVAEPKAAKKAKVAAPIAKTGTESVVPPAVPAASGSSRAAINGAEQDDSDEDSDDEDDGDISKLVHETVAGTAKKPKVKAVKYVPADETPADKARRSLFIGNLPVECANSKKGDRQLIAHLLTFAPTAKVESVRFRSIAFKNPTSGVPGEEGESKIKKRESERASAWKAEQAKLKAGGKEAEDADAAKTFLDAKGKRKVAFIKKDFHDEAAVCNAYVVFAHPHPDRSANVAPIMNPYEAATKVLEANGSRFMERHIRVDTLRDPSKTALASATTALGRRDAWLPQGTDPKKSVFVGGLDYAAKEEDVRAFFEALLVTERGPAEGEWVKEVRIVRDKDTQLGKGFGYVHFGDRQSVDEILAIEASKLKFAKKTIRVQPAKTLPSPNTRAAPEAQEKTPYKGKVRNVPATVSKGDPALGDKLKDLSKEDRKLAKATDAERQARRLAKKQKRVAMQREEKGAVKLGPTKSGHKVDKAKKSRVRSSHALSKMKGSRQ